MFTLNAMNNEKSTNQGTIYQIYSFPGKKTLNFTSKFENATTMLAKTLFMIIHINYPNFKKSGR